MASRCDPTATLPVAYMYLLWPLFAALPFLHVVQFLHIGGVTTRT